MSARLRERTAKIFADKEVYFRTQGRVTFVRISATVQIVIASLVVALLGAWLIGTLSMLYNQAMVAQDRAAIDAKAKSVAAEASKVKAYKHSVSDIAADLSRRQDALDDMVRSQFGTTSVDPNVVGAPDEQTGEPSDATKTSDATAKDVLGIRKLRSLEARQTLFAKKLAHLIDQRAARAEAAIRSFGLNPQQIAGVSAAQGGPFIPWTKSEASHDDALASLANALSRLNALERGLVSIPSGRPTAAPMQTSSYGYRRDPFNGRAAFHAGIDFRGRYGQPILAASAGRVSYVGGRQGYGKVVEIDHGHGIMTRYAHLSGFAVRPGQTVTRGATVGRMGSTGRSTGTHLHFEVRLNGNAINPRRFLEVKEDVLKVQQIAKQRFARVGTKAVKADERG